MDYLKWILPAVLALLCGALYAAFLTAHPLVMSWYMFGSTAMLGALAATLILGFRGRALLIVLPVAIVAFVAGYAIIAQAVLSREDSRPLPQLTRTKEDPGLGHTAVIYFTHGEPETYDPIGWINQFKEFDEQKVKFVPFVARPFFLYQLRQAYLKVGRSDHHQVHQRMLNSLEAQFRDAGDTTTRFYLAFLDDNPRPDAAVIQALNDGASRIVVSEVFLTVSNHTAEGKELIEALNVEQTLDVPVAFTGPMWDSETLRSMFVHRANAHLDGTDKTRVGVLLVGHGQPDEWDAEWPTETSQEIGFREQVLKLFQADGYLSENLSLAWMEFKKPHPAEKVEEFVDNGVEKVVYFAAAISADSIHSQYDIPELVHKAQVPEGFPLINLGAWNDDPIVIEAIKEKIDAQMH